MLKLVIRKLLTGIIASAIFSLLFASVSYNASTEAYFTFGSLFSLFLMISLPIFLIASITLSVVIDKYIKGKSIEILIYAAAGALIIVPYAFIIFRPTSDVYPMFMMYGASAGVVYYFIDVVMRKLWWNQNNKETVSTPPLS